MTQVLNHHSFGSRATEVFCVSFLQAIQRCGKRPRQSQAGGCCKMPFTESCLPPTHWVSHLVSHYPLQSPLRWLEEQSAIGPDVDYIWGWGEGSDHHSAASTSKERTILQAFQGLEHTAVLGATASPSLVAPRIIPAEMEL